ncbi:glutamine synthetase family protein [Paracoccus sp. MBLB3053]|uniref:Glutamine synthetase family protein n=1 Tax=Paracoccus aurantius TaxID=3073814 RepID=A0ABU2HYC3_9RHOB|nr:glutamine synthetase family protein [Paracoccus sp. MBLB3053]MDS9470031.1 glutamine synthetase family protein [Paracoccus sp. MBLB3053]
MSHPPSAHDAAYLLAAHCDLNGVFRGKRLPLSAAEKLASGGIRMPMSSIGVDIWGTDVIGNSLTFDQGDLDGIVEPTGRGPLPLAFGATPAMFTPMWMRKEDGEPFFGDPRRTLAAVIGQFEEMGLRPVVATEVEFYLVDPAAPAARPLSVPDVGHADCSDTIYSMSELAGVDAFLNEVYAVAEDCGVAVDGATSESGPGQFEFNLMHGPDALKVADDTVLFKQIVRSAARRHGFAASFMAKPYAEHSGSGLHVHFSLLDGEGRNIFDDGTREGTAAMRHAVGGVLAAMHDCTLIFAPHQNSYRRLRPGTLAPTVAAWGYENRTAALRIPGGPPVARRIEHRVSGADANPYLVIAAILAAALDGIEAGQEPPAPADGNVHDSDAPQIPADWRSALSVFETSPKVARLFHPEFIAMFAACKRQELDVFEREITALEYHSYLHTV